ncbi:MAG: helix-turn-helix transcriptional regulator [Thomasclavelia sp.]
MISTNLMHLRKLYQYTQEDVAQKVGVSRQSVAKWEAGVSQTKGY